MTPRSYLFVPADPPQRIGKALASGADAVIVDLEDAVAPTAKPAARNALAQWLETAPSVPAPPAVPLFVRVNASNTAWFEDDLRLCTHPRLNGVVLPKAQAADELARVRDAAPGRALLPLIETAAGLQASSALASQPGVQRLLFGSLDFQVDLGIEGDDDALLAFRSHLVLASRLAGLAAPVDGVSTVIDDAVAVRRDAERARRLGFGAKLCIHPRQVAAVHEGFAPTKTEVAWAQRVLQAFEAAQGSGNPGALAVDGRMVDAPVLQRARTLLERGRPN